MVGRVVVMSLHGRGAREIEGPVLGIASMVVPACISLLCISLLRLHHLFTTRLPGLFVHVVSIGGSCTRLRRSLLTLMVGSLAISITGGRYVRRASLPDHPST